MKKLFNALRWALSIAVLFVVFFMPDILSAADGGAILGVNFITSTISWGGKETLEYFIRPQFIGKAPWETQGIKVMPDIQDTKNLNFFGTASKTTKAYSKGFSGSAGTTYTQRAITVAKLKSEASEDANNFFDTVYGQVLAKGEWDDLTETELHDIIVEVWMKSVSSDIYRIFWLADSNKETLNTSLNYSGTADTDYNMITGMWARIFAVADTTPTADQIYRYQVADGAVSQVYTYTLNTGSSANLVLTVNGVNYTVAYGSSYTVTAALFVTTHAAAILLRGITVTSSGADVIFTSAIPGQPFDAVAAASASTITGTGVATTANTAPTALSSGESNTIFEDLVTNCDRVLRGTPKNEKILLVADDVYDNYIAYNETLGTEKSHTMLVDGFEMVTYRGIPVIPMGWGEHLDADFPHASGSLYAYPHRVIYTALNNLVMGMDAMSEYTQMRMWYNIDEQENRFRKQFKLGTQYEEPKLIAVAY